MDQKASFLQNNMIKRQNKGLLYTKVGSKVFGISDQNHWLTRFKICKFLDYGKMAFLWTKKRPFDKTTLINDKTNVSFTEK